MGDSVEDLLAQIKARYAETENVNQADTAPQAGAAPTPPSVQQPPASQSPGLASANSIDDLLAEIAGKPAPQRPSERALPPLQTQTDWQQMQPPIQAEVSGAMNPPDPATNRLLDELKNQYEERDRTEQLKQQEQRQAEELKHQEQLRQEQQRQAELKRQKQVAVMQQAEEWLKRLDPRSGEAAWFEEFAAKYESRLEAAIDYLGL